MVFILRPPFKDKVKIMIILINVKKILRMD